MVNNDEYGYIIIHKKGWPILRWAMSGDYKISGANFGQKSGEILGTVGENLWKSDFNGRFYLSREHGTRWG